VAVVDVQESKVLRIAYVSASRIRRIQLGPTHAWIAISCWKEGEPDYCGNAWTGVYRIGRAAIESGVQSSFGDRGVGYKSGISAFLGGVGEKALFEFQRLAHIFGSVRL